MKATELRIGNYLKRLDDSVFDVNSEDIQIIERWDSSEDLLPKPILLTEEWLKKFGFELYKKQMSLNVGGELFHYAMKNEFTIWTDLKSGWTLDSRKDRKTHWLNSVHQLQIQIK